MTPVVIIGCGAAKRDLGPGEVVAIADLYTGSLYRARLAYAQALGGPHFVVSARHGLVPAGLKVAAYEDDLHKRRVIEQVAWSDRVIHTLARTIPSDRSIVALVAGPYAAWCARARTLGWTVDVPAAGLPLGESIRVLRAAARTA